MSTQTKAIFTLQAGFAVAAGIAAFIAPWWVAVSLLAFAVILAPDVRVEDS